MFRSLWNDEAGFILSAELVLVMTIGVLAMVVGLNAVAKSINQELFDVASAFGTISQSFFVSGFLNEHGNAGFAAHGCYGGFGFEDRSDECDCAVLLTPGTWGGGNIKYDTSYGPGSGRKE